MLNLHTTETITRRADNTCISITVKVSAYKEPITMKTFLQREAPEDVDPSVSVTLPDWENNTALGSREHNFLIPIDKQTDTTPAVRGESKTAYDSLIEEWRDIYLADGDYIRMQEELMTEFIADDGYSES